MNQKLKMTLYWLIPFLGFIGMFFTFSWKNLIIFIISLLVVNIFGVDMALHRYFAHESFKARFPLHIFLCLAGCFASQGSLEMWASTHQRHHEFAETDKDPHSPKNGFFHSYFLWMFDEDRFGKKTVLTDKWSIFFSNCYLFFFLFFILIYGVFGWSAILWGGLGRIFVMNNITSITNVFGHKGKIRNKNGDTAQNRWWLAILNQGEGWHKNHHDDPSDFYFGREWWQVDVTGYFLLLFKSLGLIYVEQKS